MSTPKEPRTHPTEPRIWISMVDSRNSDDLRDLDHLDSLLWGSNPNTCRGDVVLMYRTRPYSDIAYVFVAASDARRTRRSDRADTAYVIDLEQKARLIYPVSLAKIKGDPSLTGFSFSRCHQGTMRCRKDIREEGFWEPVANLLVAGNPSVHQLLNKCGLLPNRGGRAPSPTSHHLARLRVFISYGTEDVRRVAGLRKRLARKRFMETWFDKKNLEFGDWERQIYRQIAHTDVFVLCLSSRTAGKAAGKSFLSREIQIAIRHVNIQPPGSTLVIPVKLDVCELPDHLSRWQCIELFRRSGYERLVSGLRDHARALAMELPR